MPPMFIGLQTQWRLLAARTLQAGMCSPQPPPLLSHTPPPDECVSTCFTPAKNLQQFQARSVNVIPCATSDAPTRALRATPRLQLQAMIARPRFNALNRNFRTPPRSPPGRALASRHPTPRR